MDVQAAQDLAKAINALTDRLNLSAGELYRDQGANFVPSFSQELLLDNATTKEMPIQKIAFDFKTMFFSDGTDNDTFVYVILGRANGAKTPLKFKNNSTYSPGFSLSEVTVYSPAQAGKKITINLLKDAQITTGQIVQSGTVTVAPATAMVPPANPAVGAASATKIVNANPSRKRLILQVSDSASIFFGPTNAVTNAGSTKGLEVSPGQIYFLENTCELWAYSVAGFLAGKLTVIEET